MTANRQRTTAIQPTLIPRPEHNISRANISQGALRVLRQLKDAGFAAHLVGGGVRDLLLGREPKDFDVATDAHPDQVKQVFGRHCRLIGRRFRLAHVRMGREIIEVATFRGRADAKPGADPGNGMLQQDNVYGSIEEDALRRDFTINALYYNIADFSVLDFGQGMVDLRAGTLRLLGDPQQRFQEDPVRMLRAVRFAAKLGFNIDRQMERLIPRHADLLKEVPSARLYDECLKLFHGGQALETFEKLRHYHLFEVLFPDTERCLADEEEHFPITFVSHGLHNTDQRINQDKPVTPAFLFAVLLWEPVRRQARILREQEGEAEIPALQQAGGEMIARLVRRVAVPRRFSLMMREIWQLQPRFDQRQGKRPLRLASHPRFRAAYDFLLLRAQAGEVEQELADWWTQFQQNEGAGVTIDPELSEDTAPKKRRRRRPRKKPEQSQS
ncbi:MAG: polynucleotide adenylyltransferase PcnB [Gammaproteobacteria bacterium SHHR-1]|uniref:polynucleotide adenylyltransferase PcnB n=1 Tax=Magnetovirga frankeli TaxID=947516 RepID=UPI001293F10C|nr:polynucleotide adenylyltransferase PcnB [gamma proteobacterium SS-5]